MPRLTAPETYRGIHGSKRGPALSACSLRDVAARRRPAGYRQVRSRVKSPRAAGACHPCPGTRHDVPRVRCGRGDAGLPSPRRCSRLTSARGVGRADAATEAPGNRPVHVEHDDIELLKPLSTPEFLNRNMTPQRAYQERLGGPTRDVQDYPSFYELLIHPSPFVGCSLYVLPGKRLVIQTFDISRNRESN